MIDHQLVKWLKQEAERKQWLPAKINPDGTIENITQIEVVQQGRKLCIPKKGKPNSHIFLTQKEVKNGKITDELAFRSTAVNMEDDTDIARDMNGKPSKYLEHGAMIVKLGREVRTRNIPRSWEQIFSRAARAAHAYLSNSTKDRVNTGSEQVEEL